MMFFNKYNDIKKIKNIVDSISLDKNSLVYVEYSDSNDEFYITVKGGFLASNVRFSDKIHRISENTIVFVLSCEKPRLTTFTLLLLFDFFYFCIASFAVYVYYLL